MHQQGDPAAIRASDYGRNDEKRALFHHASNEKVKIIDIVLCDLVNFSIGLRSAHIHRKGAVTIAPCRLDLYSKQSAISVYADIVW